MKLCSICKKRPVDSPRGKYCAECRALLKNKKHTVENAVKNTEKAFTGCDGCIHWRDCGHGTKCCHLTIDTGKLRTLPYKACYKHEGTDYEGVKSR